MSDDLKAVVDDVSDEVTDAELGAWVDGLDLRDALMLNAALRRHARQLLKAIEPDDTPDTPHTR